MSIFTVNGKTHSFDGDPEMPLLWYLRDVAGRTGTKLGCGRGLCGACIARVATGKRIRALPIRDQLNRPSEVRRPA